METFKHLMTFMRSIFLFMQIVSMKKSFFKLLAERWDFHTEHKLRCERSNPFLFLFCGPRSIFLNFCTCKQTHRPINQCWWLWNKCHVCLSQQKHWQQWLTSLFCVSLCTKRCLTNETQLIKTTALKTTFGSWLCHKRILIPTFHVFVSFSHTACKGL